MNRLDQVLVYRGLVASRTAAARHIQTGAVLVNDRLVTKPATKIGPDDHIQLKVSGPQYASRAGHKLAGALEHFNTIDVSGRRCLDAGASTGGFTDVLLQQGAKYVVAVDVGHDQIIPRLRNDPRVEVHEGLNIRHLGLSDIGAPVDIVVSDLSFISLKLALAPLARVCTANSHLILMIKPQFEVGRDRLSKTGVVTDPQQRQEAVRNVIQAAVDERLKPRGVAASPLPGQDGNKEFFFWATHNMAEGYLDSFDIDQWLATQRVQWHD